jgi:hypothetical protein
MRTARLLATASTWVALLHLSSACRKPGPEASAGDASLPAAVTAPIDASQDSAGSSPAEETRDRAEAGGARQDAELTLEVQGGFCAPESRGTPGCRSYTYVLRSDGKLRGGRRRSAVPVDVTDALFDLATSAFDAKYTCIPNGPDRGGQSISLRRSGKVQTARGGCGRDLQTVRTRLEELAAED